MRHRQPDDQPVTDDDEDMQRLFALAMRNGLTYNEGGDLKALCTVLKWCAGAASALAVAGIVGAVVMYGNVRDLQGQVADLKTTVDHIYKLVEPRFRGAPDEPANAATP